MDDHHFRASVDPLECQPHGVLAALAAIDDPNRFRARAQEVEWCGRQLRGQRDDDLVNGVGFDERIDTALENRASAEYGELLRLPAAETKPASARGNDCGNVSSQTGDSIKADLKVGLYFIPWSDWPERGLPRSSSSAWR
jgi:hypothetical protein